MAEEAKKRARRNDPVYLAEKREERRQRRVFLYLVAPPQERGEGPLLTVNSPRES